MNNVIVDNRDGGASALAILAMAFGIMPDTRIRRRRNELEGVDIDAEYELIKQKKSKLSRMQRDRVCFIAEKTACKH